MLWSIGRQETRLCSHQLMGNGDTLDGKIHLTARIVLYALLVVLRKATRQGCRFSPLRRSLPRRAEHHAD